MRDIAAVIAALDMSHNPSSVRLAQRAALPIGTPFLLEIAAGEADAIALASAQTGRTEARIRDAAGFFIEQVLLHPECDSYRVLGGSAGTPPTVLRRNMALLLKWLHPDVASHAAEHETLDRSVFANRVTKAWEDLKTQERRADYDRSLASRSRNARKPAPSRQRLEALVVKPQVPRKPMKRPRMPPPSKRREDFVTRFVRMLLGDRR